MGKKRRPRLPGSYKVRVMPKKLQYYMLKKLFYKANEDWCDPSAEWDNIDFEGYYDARAEYRETVEDFKNIYPQYRWAVPEKYKFYKDDEDEYFDFHRLEKVAMFVLANAPTAKEMDSFLRGNHISQTLLSRVELHCIAFSSQIKRWVYVPENDSAKLGGVF